MGTPQTGLSALREYAAPAVHTMSLLIFPRRVLHTFRNRSRREAGDLVIWSKFSSRVEDR